MRQVTFGHGVRDATTVFKHRWAYRYAHRYVKNINFHIHFFNTSIYILHLYMVLIKNNQIRRIFEYWNVFAETILRLMVS